MARNLKTSRPPDSDTPVTTKQLNACLSDLEKEIILEMGDLRAETNKQIIRTAIACVITLFGLLWLAQRFGHSVYKDGYTTGSGNQVEMNEVDNELAEIRALVKSNAESVGEISSAIKEQGNDE